MIQKSRNLVCLNNDKKNYCTLDSIEFIFIVMEAGTPTVGSFDNQRRPLFSGSKTMPSFMSLSDRKDTTVLIGFFYTITSPIIEGSTFMY